MDSSSQHDEPQKKRSAVRSSDEDSKPAAKRSRGKKYELVAQHVTIPLDALSLLIGFLSPRQLYRLAFTCKTLRDFITTQMVVQSSMIHGGHAKKTMEELHNLMSVQAMHVPSPLRLLRLANGKRCEFCCAAKVNFVRPCLGVFACWGCTTERQNGLTQPWKTTWVRYQKNRAAYDAVFRHPRVATNSYGPKQYMWASPKTLECGERIGPLATFRDVDQMFAFAKDGGDLDTYIKDRLHAPPDADYKDFNQAYLETEKRAEQVADEREKKKAEKKKDYKANKLAKIDKMISDLSKLLDQPCPKALLSKTDLDYGNGGVATKHPSVRFAIPFVHDLMRPYVITPSKIRKKILVDIAAAINSKLVLLTNFLTLDFLSQDDPFEVELKLHFREKLTDLESLLAMKKINQHLSLRGLHGTVVT